MGEDGGFGGVDWLCEWEVWRFLPERTFLLESAGLVFIFLRFPFLREYLLRPYQ
jgi:hypothetical protein